MPGGVVPAYPSFSKQAEANQKKVTHTTSAVIQPNTLDLSRPTIATGQVMPYLLGRQINKAPLLLWYGNIQLTYEVTTSQQTTTDEDGNETVETVYTYTPKSYLADFQLGLALGPNVALRSIYYKGQKVWAGTATGRTEFDIGENISPLRECIFNGGAFDQARDPYLESVANEDGDTTTPGYVGIAYIILKGVPMDELGAMAFEVERYPDVLGLGSSTNKIGDDLNVISAIADIITNDWGGCGQPLALIDEANFEAAAALMKAQGNGCSMINASPVAGSDLIEPLLMQCRGFLFINPETNQYQINLFSLPLNKKSALRLYDSDFISAGEFNKTSWLSVPDSISLEYTDRSLTYASVPVLGRNLASDCGNKSTNSIAMPTVMTKQLATNMLSREMSIQACPSQTVQLSFNRKAADLLPGEVVVLTLSKYKYYSVPMLVERRRTHPVENNQVTLTGTIFPYAGNRLLFTPPGDSFFRPPDGSPLPPANVTLIELPYFFNSDYSTLAKPFTEADYDIDTPAGSYPFFAVERANARQSGFIAKWKTKPNLSAWPFPYTAESYVTPSSIMYSNVGQLREPIDKFDSWDGSPLDIELENMVYYEGARAPFYGYEVGQNFPTKGLVFIGNEIFLYDPAVGSNWTYTKASNRLVISNCYRCMIDSVAEDHDAGEFAYIMSFTGGSPESFTNRVAQPALSALTDDLEFYGKGLVFGVEKLSATAFTIDKNSYAAGDRYKAPYRPHNTKIDGSRSSSPVALAIGDTVNVSWVPRVRRFTKQLQAGVYSRVTPPPYAQRQTDPVTPSVLGSVIGSERDADGNVTRYRVWIEDINGDPYDCGATSAGTTLIDNLDIEVPVAAPGLGWLWVEAEFNQWDNKQRSSSTVLKSIYKDRLPIEIVPASP